jgi:hypothetical protein
MLPEFGCVDVTVVLPLLLAILLNVLRRNDAQSGQLLPATQKNGSKSSKAIIWLWWIIFFLKRLKTANFAPLKSFEYGFASRYCGFAQCWKKYIV